jgi:hypothetical protein
MAFSRSLPEQDASRAVALAVIALRKNNREEAIAWLEHAAEVQFKGVEAAYYHGVQQYLYGEAQQAFALWSRLGETTPGMAEKTGRLLQELATP